MRVFERAKEKQLSIFVALQPRLGSKTHGKGKCFSVRETTVDELYKVLIAACRKKELNSK